MRDIINRAIDYWWLISVPLVIGALIFAAAWFNPVEEVDGPIGAAVGITHNECEEGWEADKVDSEHLQVLTCIRLISDDEARTFEAEYNANLTSNQLPITVPISGRLVGTEWVVVLNEDGTFSHGYPLDTAGADFIYVEDQIPGWLR